jgi:hypothetical protein
MHMMHPALSTSGKRKGKVKFRNAEEAQKHRELESDWLSLQKKWGIEAEEKKRKRALEAEPLVYNLTSPPGRSGSQHIKSLDTGHSGPISSKPSQQYSGSACIGLGQLHKSNSVPVFSTEEAIDIAKMRRG